MRWVIVLNNVKYIIIFCIAVSIVFLTQYVYAFTTKGRWDSPPYPDLYYYDACGSDEYYAVIDAANEWNDINVIYPPRLTFTTGPPIHIHIDDYYDPNTSTVAYTELTIVDGYIQLIVYIYLNVYWTSRYDYHFKVATATHEFGHALGLGHSEYEWALMYPYIDVYYLKHGAYYPTQDEINVINYLYGGG